MSRLWDKSPRLRGGANQARRRRWFARHPLCVACEKRGLVVEATELDHVIPLGQGGADDASNLQGLCRACHAIKSVGEQDAAVGIAFPEWLQPVLGRLTIVYGPPASGKTTYVRKHASRFDRIIDLDAIACEISGLPMYQTDAYLGKALYMRNHMLSDLSKRAHTAWLIVTGRKPERQWWERKLRPAEQVVMETTEAECVARIRADPARKLVAARQIGVVRDWFASERGVPVQVNRACLYDENGRVVW